MSALVDEADRPATPPSAAPADTPSDAALDAAASDGAAVDSAAPDVRIGHAASVDAASEPDLFTDRDAVDERGAAGGGAPLDDHVEADAPVAGHDLLGSRATVDASTADSGISDVSIADPSIVDESAAGAGAAHESGADVRAAHEGGVGGGPADESAGGAGGATGYDDLSDIDGGTPESHASDEAEDDAMAGDEASQNGRAYDGVGSVSDSPAYDGHAYEGAEYEGAEYEYEDAGYGDAEHDGEFGDRDEVEETVFVASSSNDQVPYMRAAEAIRHATPPTRADLRIDFGAHLEANYRRLVAQLYAITLDPAEAHSVVQDAYSRAWRSWASISRTPDPTGWVRRVAVRSTMRSWRRFRLKSRQPLGPGPDTSVGAVLAALRRLPPSERRCVVLHHMAGAPLPEIAAVEGLSVGTTAARLARAQQVVSAGLLSDVRVPEPQALDGWASPEWDGHRVAAAAHDQEDQR